MHGFKMAPNIYKYNYSNHLIFECKITFVTITLIILFSSIPHMHAYVALIAKSYLVQYFAPSTTFFYFASTFSIALEWGFFYRSNIIDISSLLAPPLDMLLSFNSYFTSIFDLLVLTYDSAIFRCEVAKELNTLQNK